MDSAEPPVARSCASKPSRTLIVVANDERTEPFSASQFQICKLFIQQPTNQAIHIWTKIGAQCGDPAIDTRLDLAAEEPLPSVLPVTVISHQRHRPPDPVRMRIDSEIMQQLKSR